MLAVTVLTSTDTSSGLTHASTAARTASAISHAAAVDAPGSTTTYSSPPKRAPGRDRVRPRRRRAVERALCRRRAGAVVLRGRAARALVGADRVRDASLVRRDAVGRPTAHLGDPRRAPPPAACNWRRSPTPPALRQPAIRRPTRRCRCPSATTFPQRRWPRSRRRRSRAPPRASCSSPASRPCSVARHGLRHLAALAV